MSTICWVFRSVLRKLALDSAEDYQDFSKFLTLRVIFLQNEIRKTQYYTQVLVFKRIVLTRRTQICTLGVPIRLFFELHEYELH